MEFIEVRKLSYIGNRQTNKYSNNIQLYVQPYFTDKDTISLIDLRSKQKTTQKKVMKKDDKIRVSKMGMGRYTYYRFLSSQLSQHTDKFCLLMNISKAIETQVIKRSGNLDKYLLVSDDPKKEPLLLVVLNAKFRELISYE